MEDFEERLLELLARIHVDLHHDLLKLSSDLHELTLAGQGIHV